MNGNTAVKRTQEVRIDVYVQCEGDSKPTWGKRKDTWREDISAQQILDIVNDAIEIECEGTEQ